MGPSTTIAKEVEVEMYSPMTGRNVKFSTPDDFAEFLKEKVNPLLAQPMTASVLEKTLSENDFVPGMIAEFGVFSGKTINQMADKFDDRTVWGFDSFEGFTEDWQPTGSNFKISKEFFHRRGTLPQVRENVRLVKGFFHESLPGFLEEHSDNFSLINIDCDLYESTRVVFELCSDRIVPGTVIVFDEFFDYLHEARAFFEFLTASNRSFRWLSYGGDAGIIFDSAANRLFNKNMSRFSSLTWTIIKPLISTITRRNYLNCSAAVVIE